MIWVAKNLYFFNCLLDGAHTSCYMVCFFYSLEEAGCENSYVFWDWNNYMWYVKIKEHIFDFGRLMEGGV